MTPDQHKALIAPLRAALYDFAPDAVRRAIEGVMADDVLWRFAHPLGEGRGQESFYDTVLKPLHHALPDLERRDHIVMAGPTPEGAHWVGCGGFYTGTFTRPWLDIPPTGHIVHMRHHEFFRFENGKITEIQALWDIPEVMMQARVWPMAPSLGRNWHIPGPASQDGIVPGPWQETASMATCQHIIDMLTAMKRHPSQGGPEVMEMDRYWHPKMMWYGPAGIGSGRGVAGFRNWHQIPFLNGMPDRGQYVDEIEYHFFGDGQYAAVTGWPDMLQTITHGGWMGIAPAGKKVEMRSLDFWRLEEGRIRENWVLVDLLHLYDQIGVDVLARMREMTSAPGVARQTFGDL